MRRSCVLLIGLVVALSATLSSAAAPAPRGAAPAMATAQYADYCLDAEEQAFLNLINTYRKQHGLGTLQASKMVSAAATYHSAEMADYNYFSHTLLNGVSWSQNMSNHGYTANTYRGENIAAGNGAASGTFTQWKNSPSHNANMLGANYSVIGIGRAYNAHSTFKWYWTTDFGGYVYSSDVAPNCSTSGTAPAPTPTPKPAPAPSSGTAYRIVASGRTANSYSSTNAYDGQYGTAWTTLRSSTPPSAAYVWFDLGSSKPIGTIQWQFLATGWADSMRVQVSHDRRTWTTLTRATNAPAGVWQSLATPGTTARYVRFYFANPNKDLRLGAIAEVKFLA